MENKKEEKKKSFYCFNLVSVFCAIVLLILFVMLIEIFTIPTAWALEIVSPNDTKIVDNTTYYGYKLPTRPTDFDGSSSASVVLNLSGFFNSNWTLMSTSPELLYLRDIDERIINEVDLINSSLNTNHSVGKVWTNNINLGQRITTLWPTAYDFYYSIGFRPSAFTDNVNYMFENGWAIYQTDSLNMNNDYAYSYDFDMILYNFDSNLVNELPTTNTINSCQLGLNNTMSCVNNQYTITSETIVNNQHIIYRKYHVYFKQNSFKFGFNKYVIGNGSYTYGFEGNNIFAFSSQYNIFSSDNLIISEPYNIEFWSTTNQYSCSTNCWTQEDTDNNQRINNYNDYLIDNVSNVIDNFDYYGFSGIITYTYDFIKELLDDANDSCIDLNVPILGKTIKLPSSCTFWGRQDIQQYEIFYHMFWCGIVALWLGFKIYNDILSVYNPDSKIDDEVVKL